MFPGEGFYFLDEQDLFERASIFQNYFLKGLDRKFIAYAIKANPLPRVLEILSSAGINAFDCASIGEIERVRSIVGDLAHIFYNNPVRGRGKVKRALELGVEHFTADYTTQNTFNETDEADLFELAMRINPSDSSGEIKLGEKYGLPLAEGVDQVGQLVMQNRVKTGVSMHIGSQNFSPKIHAKQISLLRTQLQANGITNLNSFNIGGGIPVKLEADKAENKLILIDYLETLEDPVVLAVRDVLAPDGKLIIEPGRSMIAPSVDMVAPINEVVQKQDGSRIVYVEDGIFTSFSDAVIHGWVYEFRWLRANGSVHRGPFVKSILNGRSCDSGDCVYDVMIPADIQPGDYLWCPNAGAYMSSQSTAFNGFNSHPYIVYNGL